MEQNYIEKQIKRVSRNKIIVLVIALIGLIVFFLTAGANILNVIAKDAKATDYHQMAKEFDKKNVYVKRTKTDTYDTGFYSYEQGKSSNKVYYYVFLVKDGKYQKYVFYKTKKYYSKKQLESLTIEGEMKRFETIDYQIYNKAIASISTQLSVTNEQAREYLANNLIIDGDNKKIGMQVTYGLIGLGILFVSYFIIRNILILSNYKRDKTYQKLEKQLKKEPESYSSAIERELNEDLVINQKVFKMTKTFILHNTLFSFNLKLKENLIWAYYNIIQHRTNGIPSGKSYSIVLYFKEDPKGTLTITVGNKKKTLEVIDILEEDCSHAIIGFSNELKKLYNSNYQEFIKLVEEKKLK